MEENISDERFRGIALRGLTDFYDYIRNMAVLRNRCGMCC